MSPTLLTLGGQGKKSKRSGLSEGRYGGGDRPPIDSKPNQSKPNFVWMSWTCTCIKYNACTLTFRKKIESLVDLTVDDGRALIAHERADGGAERLW